MNSNNFYDRYKFAKYYLCGNLAVFLAGIIVLCIFGFNVSSTQGAHLILQSVLTVLISLVVILIYIGIRYDWAKAFAILLIAVHNILLSTALICIIRIPVAESLSMGYVLLIGLSAVFGLILFEKLEKIEYKKADLNKTINGVLNENVKFISVFNIIVVAVMFLCLIFSSSLMFDFAREFFVMMVVLLYSVITIMLPVYFFFAKRIVAKRRARIDSSVDNQKVYQAVAQEVAEDSEVNDKDVSENE